MNTMPEGTLKAFGDHGIVKEAMSLDSSAAEAAIKQFTEAGIDVDALGQELQDEGAKSFVKSWTDLMDVISEKGAELLQTR